MLAAHLDEYVDNDRYAVVFTSVRGSPLLNRYFGPNAKRALEVAGLEESIRFHDLRHHAGSPAIVSPGRESELPVAVRATPSSFTQGSAEGRYDTAESTGVDKVSIGGFDDSPSRFDQ